MEVRVARTALRSGRRIMWSTIRDLVTRTAEAVGVDVPELPDVSAVTERRTGATDTVTQAATEALSGATDAASAVTESAAPVQAVGDAAIKVNRVPQRQG